MKSNSNVGRELSGVDFGWVSGRVRVRFLITDRQHSAGGWVVGVPTFSKQKKKNSNQTMSNVN